MALPRDVFVVGAARTAIGTFGGALKDVPWPTLATLAVKTALSAAAPPRERRPPGDGHGDPTEPRDAYLSRVAAVNAGLPQERRPSTSTACGSGPAGHRLGAAGHPAGDCASRHRRRRRIDEPRRLPAAAGGLLGRTHGRLAHARLRGRCAARPFHKIHMGITAENVGEQFGISRTQMDELAVESHCRAAAAIAAGRFKSRSCRW